MINIVLTILKLKKKKLCTCFIENIYKSFFFLVFMIIYFKFKFKFYCSNKKVLLKTQLFLNILVSWCISSVFFLVYNLLSKYSYSIFMYTS